MRKTGFLILCVVIGIAIIWTSNLFGLWWMTMLVGSMLGLILRDWKAFAASLLSGGLSWGLPLALQAVTLPIGRTASVVASITSLGDGTVILVATILLGVLLCVAGAWLGVALRSFLPKRRRHISS